MSKGKAQAQELSSMTSYTAGATPRGSRPGNSFKNYEAPRSNVSLFSKSILNISILCFIMPSDLHWKEITCKRYILHSLYVLSSFHFGFQSCMTKSITFSDTWE